MLEEEQKIFHLKAKMLPARQKFLYEQCTGTRILPRQYISKLEGEAEEGVVIVKR